ncbi:MobF family relaxase [Anabaena sp. CCY 0017]|uniref:MobF family relaxase n=1 Tax=Anabaena sp. CCY 0017 TaxID=3103866 RepID=UPI0039C6CADF
MLTGKNSEPQQAVHYFLEGYYQEGESRWSGLGAKKLGLSGAVDNQETFTNIVNGLSPDGNQKLCARRLDSSLRRAATDFTFSAPKSVSLQALVGGDEQLIQAHILAVQKTLELIEQRYSYTRVTTEIGRETTRTGNLVVAQFDHIETRELDPHLHTHALVMNMTRLDNGQWYSLLNDEIFKNKKFLGMVYQNYLAVEIQKLGYQVEARNHGQFEIKGWKPEDLKEFSKRRQQILEAVGENATRSEREQAWTATRNRKQKIHPEELKAKWREEAKALGIKFVQPGNPQPELQPRLVSYDNLEDAIAHCSERNVAFTQEELEKFILNQGLATEVKQIEPLIKANPELLSLSPQTRDYTTLAAVNRELATIKLMQDGQSKVSPLAHPEVIVSHLEQTTLNLGQRRAVETAATTKDQFIAWQGVAGAGKTFALKELKKIAADTGYTIKGFAPSAMAAKVLSLELDIQAETVARLLISEPPQEIDSQQIWIVDEAGLLSAKDAISLLERATQEQARVLLVGDTKQLSAVEAGNPFKSLQQAGIKTSYLNESLRQRAPELKLAVDLIAEGRIQEGFERLDENGSIHSVSSELKIETIARDYVTATPEQRARTLVLAGTNFERLAITQAIREKLKVEGSLGTGINITQLKAKDLTRVQMRYTHNFELGDVVMPTRDYKRRGLEKGKLYEVVGKDNDRLTLKADDGQQFQVNTGFEQAVYQRQRIEIAVGDRLRWTKNNRDKGHKNGQEFVVTQIRKRSAVIQYLDSGKTESLSFYQGHNLDYALVSTTYSSQGKTADKVLIAADNTIGQESFYVAVSRARHELKLYTEDKDYLLAQAQLSRAKENALALLRQQELAKQHQSKLEKEQVVAATTVAKKPSTKQKNFEVREQGSEGAEEKTDCQTSFQRESGAVFTPTPVPNSSPMHLVQRESEATCIPAPVPIVVKTQPSQVPERTVPTPKPVINKPVPKTPQPTVVKTQPPQVPERIVPTPKPVINKPVPKTPQPKVAFWTPDNSVSAPERLDEQHWQELIRDSAIHPEIAHRNFTSLHQTREWEHEAWEYLMYSHKLPRTNTGRLSLGIMSKYAHIESGGWWCDAGVNPLSFADLQPGDKPERKLWGCYKPNEPREKADKPRDALGQKNGGGLINPTTICDANTTNHEARRHFSSHSPAKFIKYEHPPKTELSIFLLDVPDDIAERIYEKAGVRPTEKERASGFWYCVWKHNLPVTITEGAKKAASLLSQGHVTIGLPGIYAGYRSKDEFGERVKARLMDELAVFATPGREMTFCFDYETRPETQRNIDIAISRTGGLLEEQGAKVNVVTLPGPDKGVDDLIVAQGALAYEQVYYEALTLKEWRDNNNKKRHSPPAPPKKLSSEERKQLLATRFNRHLELEQKIQDLIHQLDNDELIELVDYVDDYFHQQSSSRTQQDSFPDEVLKMKITRQLLKSEEIIARLEDYEQSQKQGRGLRR